MKMVGMKILTIYFYENQILKIIPPGWRTPV